jgi:hypothetical protein
MTAAPKFRIDVTINDLLTSPDQRPPAPAEPKGVYLSQVLCTRSFRSV